MLETTSRANGLKSRVCARVEHVFARQKSRMDLFVRTIGIAQATTKIGPAADILGNRSASIVKGIRASTVTDLSTPTGLQNRIITTPNRCQIDGLSLPPTSIETSK